MSRICPGDLLSPSYIIKKSFFLRDEPSVSFLLLTEWSLYLSEAKNKAKAEYARKRKHVVICKQFFPATGLPVHRGASDNFLAKN